MAHDFGKIARFKYQAIWHDFGQLKQAMLLESPHPKTSFGPDAKKPLLRATHDLQKR